MPKVTIEQDGRNLSARYSKQQIGRSETYLTTLSQRHDVAQAISQLQGLIRKPKLEHKRVTARNGAEHDYLVVRKGRKRMLFDMPEDPTIQQEPSNMVLVVPYQTMQEKGLIPDGSGFSAFHNNREARQLVREIRREGYFAGRRSGANVDTAYNTDFLQIVSAMVVLAKKPDERVLFAIRGQINNDSLALKTTPFPVMGHNEYADAGHLTNTAKHALLREAGEEVSLKNERTQAIIQNEPPWITALRLRRNYRIRPFGVIHRKDTDVDQLHEGIVFIAEPKTNRFSLTLNANSNESTQIMWQTPQEYRDAVTRGEQHPAGWNQPVLDALELRRKQKR